MIATRLLLAGGARSLLALAAPRRRRADPLRDHVRRREHRASTSRCRRPLHGRHAVPRLLRDVGLRERLGRRARRRSATSPARPASRLPAQTGTRAAHAQYFDDRYVTVLASLRGTGCSSGEFDLFSWRSALDGREVIDNWIAEQPWSNGDVGDLRPLLRRHHRHDGRRDAAAAPARGQRLRPDRRPLPRHRLSRRRHQLRLPAAVDRRRAAGLRRRRRHGRRPDPAGEHQRAVRGQPGRPLAHGPRGPADPGPRRHRQRVVPLALAGHLRRPDPGAGPHHRRLPGRADRRPRPDQRVRPPARAGSRSGSCWSTASTARRPRRTCSRTGSRGWTTGCTAAAWLDHWLLATRTARRSRATATTTSRVLLGYQGDGRAVGEIDSDGFPLGQTQFTDAYVSVGGR